MVGLINAGVRTRRIEFLPYMPEFFEIRMRIACGVFASKRGITSRPATAAVIFEFSLYWQREKGFDQLVGFVQIGFGNAMVS